MPTDDVGRLGVVGPLPRATVSVALCMLIAAPASLVSYVHGYLPPWLLSPGLHDSMVTCLHSYIPHWLAVSMVT